MLTYCELCDQMSAKYEVTPIVSIPLKKKEEPPSLQAISFNLFIVQSTQIQCCASRLPIGQLVEMSCVEWFVKKKKKKKKMSMAYQAQHYPQIQLIDSFKTGGEKAFLYKYNNG